MTAPVIGLTLDSEPPGTYSKTHPWYAIRENYCDAVARAGGLPILLPHDPDRAADYLALIDGLIVTGGAFDVDPALFGATTKHASVTTKERRTQFELAVTRGAISADKPVLGICGGMQLMNVALGGTLIQHIPDEWPNALAHEQPNPRTEPGHTVKVEPGTLLHRVTRMEEMPVNSAHHQAVKDAGPGVLHRLMMRRVDRHFAHARDAMKQRAGFDFHGVARLGARVGLLVRQRVRPFVGNVLDQGAAERDI